jgi:hypothetical protein
MISILNLLIFSIIYAYLFTSGINFFSPITIPLAIVIVFLSLIAAFISLVLIPFETFSLPERKRPSNILVVIVLGTFASWTLFVTRVPSTAVDANVYHLPLSLLMNHSVWYPGIAGLSSHFGFPNGTSVLASLFTCFDSVGMENVPNVVVWAILGVGIFLYLHKRTEDLLVSIPVSLLFLFTPRLFLESYNIGTDLPAACFLALGLLALTDEKLDDACILLSLSAVFKTLGVLAAGLVVPYVVIVYASGRGEPTLSRAKILISVMLLVMSFARIYIATGNPFYPSWPLNLAPWGISEDIQNGLINGTGTQGTELTGAGLKNYSGVERSLSGLLAFGKNFVFFPHIVKSEYWFSPFLFACAVVSSYGVVTRKYYRRVHLNSIYSYLVVTLLIVAWLYYSPLFRFIAGVLIFVNLRVLVLAIREGNGFPKIMIRCVAFGTLLLFLFNAGEHITKDIIPLVNASEESIERFMPWIRKRGAVKTEFVTKRTEDGFVYSKSSSTYCHRLKPPCINSRSLGGEEMLIQQFRKYNRI